MIDPQWKSKAKCFPLALTQPMAAAWIEEDHAMQKRAKAICVTCPVRMSCLQSALDSIEEEEEMLKAEGIYGGYWFDSGTLPVADAREIKANLPVKLSPRQSLGRAKQ